MTDDAPSIEMEREDIGTPAPAEAAAEVAVPSDAGHAEPSAEPPTASADEIRTVDTPSEIPVGRESDGNPDINAQLLKANAEPKINGSLVGAAQEGQENATEQREERREKEKEEFENALERAQEAGDARKREQEEEKQRKEWESKTHRMGGLDLSGADLDKLLNFMKSPAAIAKVESAMKAKGASQKQIDKAQKELKEYQELKEKEKSGGTLTPQELRRLQEINKSPEFQQFSQKATEVARKDGINLSSNKTAETQAAQAAENRSEMREKRVVEDESKDNHQKNVTDNSNSFSDMTSQALASERFASAPQLTNKFSASAALPTASAQMPDVANDAAMGAQVSIAAATQTKPKPVADVSFR